MNAVASVVAYARRGRQVHYHQEGWTSFRRGLPWRASPPNTAGCCPQFQLRQGQGVLQLSRGCREGVEVHQVNPAYSSSVIGRVKFVERYGLSVHQGADLVLARRLLGCSERIPCRWVSPVGNGVHVAFSVPARKRVKHVWTYWGAVSGTAETGACSAAPAGDAETRTQSGSGRRA